MKEKDKAITNMQQLAETGWQQMQELLRQHIAAEIPVSSSKKRNLFPLVAAGVILGLIFSYPFILNNNKSVYLHSKLNTATSSFTKNLPTAKQPVKMISPAGASDIRSSKKNRLSQKVNRLFLPPAKKHPSGSIQPEASFIQKPPTYVKQSDALKEASPKPLNEGKPNLAFPRSSAKKSTIPASKKIRFFAGVGINVSAWNKNSHSFTFSNLNIHPGFAVIIPVSKKLSVHSGLWAFSTVHAEVSVNKQERVNNLSSNIYYNIHTTSLIKASYFDIPLTLHYSIHKNWSVGTGLQLSKLYKMNMSEQKESFDNNMRLLATTPQYSSTTSQAAALQNKVDIKKYDPRFVAQANFQHGKWLFLAEYYYGLKKTITLIEANNATHPFRNTHFKLGIQYKIKVKQ